MDHLAFGLKILLALGACYLAFAAVAVETRSADISLPWIKRLNVYGVSALTTALGVLLAAVLSEYLTARGEEEKSRQVSSLQTRLKELERKLEKSRELTDDAVARLRAADKESQLLQGLFERMEFVSSRDKFSFVPSPESIASSNRGIQSIDSIIPSVGDRITWRLQCPRGNAWRAAQTPECLEGVLGHLNAYSAGFWLNDTSGGATIIGHGPPHALMYHPPSGHCEPVAAEIQQQRCELHIEHFISGSSIIRDAIHRRLSNTSESEFPRESDFCRHYRLLYGQPCPDIK